MIAAELEMELPNLNLDDVAMFIEKTKEFHQSAGNFNLEEKKYEERNNRNYPWHRRLLEFNGTCFYNYLEEGPFSVLKNTINNLPIIDGTRVVLLLYQEKQKDYDFNFHFDKDDGYGFRICYGLKVGQPFVEFSKLKEQFLYVRNTLEPIKNFMVEDSIYELIPKRENSIFVFNGSIFPHRVPILESTIDTHRLSIIVRGKIQTISNLTFSQVLN